MYFKLTPALAIRSSSESSESTPKSRRAHGMAAARAPAAAVVAFAPTLPPPAASAPPKEPPPPAPELPEPPPPTPPPPAALALKQGGRGDGKAIGWRRERRSGLLVWGGDTRRRGVWPLRSRVAVANQAPIHLMHTIAQRARESTVFAHTKQIHTQVHTRTITRVPHKHDAHPQTAYAHNNANRDRGTHKLTHSPTRPL